MRRSVLLFISMLATTGLGAQNELSIQTKAAERGAVGIQLFIGLSHDVGFPGLAGFSFGLQHDTAALDLVDLEYFLTLIDPDFIQVSVPAVGTPFPTIAVVFAFTPPFEYLSPGSYTIARAVYDVPLLAPFGLSDVIFAPVGSPPVETLFADAAGMDFPPDVVTDGGIVILEPIPQGVIENQLWFPNGADQTVSIVDPDGLVLATGSGAPDLNPGAVAVGANGIGWVCFADSGTVLRFTPDGTVLGNPIAIGSSATSVCIGPNNNAWVTDSVAGTLSKVSPGGTVLLGDGGALGPAIVVGPNPQGVASDRLGNVWVAVTGDSRLKKFNNNGALAVVVDLPALSEPFGIAIARTGIVWVTLRGTEMVQRRGSDGSLIETFGPLPPGSNPEGVVIRGANEAWVAADLPYRFAPGAPPDPIDAVGTPDPTGIAIDGNGRIWITVADGTAHRFDADGTPALFNPVTIGTLPSLTGDASGMIQASVLRRNDDFDGDGFPNVFELNDGTNPFDDASFPATVPTVTDLSCTIDAQDVTLAWNNPPLVYDSIEIRRFDSLGGFIDLPPLAGDVELAVDSGVPLGAFTYEVVGVLGLPSAPATCGVIVGQGGIQGANPIGVDIGEQATNLFDVAAVPAAVTGPRFYATDSGSGVIYALDANYLVVALFDSPFQGLVPSTGIAFSPTGDSGNGSLFIASGGDATVPAQIVETTLSGAIVPTTAGGAGLFDLSLPGPIPILGSLGGLSYDADLDTLYAVGPTGCEIYSMVVADAGLVTTVIENPTGPAGGLNGVDFLGTATGTLAEFSLLVTGSEGTGDPPQYIVALVDVSGGLATEVASISLSSLDVDENVFGGFALVDGSLSVVGSTSSVVYEVLTTRPFIRGDANNDGAVQISDAISILSAQFSAGEFFDCPLAFDVNDDGSADIADAIYLLSFLFIPGSPQPPMPFPDFGLSPTASSLLCF